MKEETTELIPVEISLERIKKILKEEDIAKEMKRITSSEFFQDMLKSFVDEVKNIIERYGDEYAYSIKHYTENANDAVDCITNNFMTNIVVESLNKSTCDIGKTLKELILAQLKDECNVTMVLAMTIKTSVMSMEGLMKDISQFNDFLNHFSDLFEDPED